MPTRPFRAVLAAIIGLLALGLPLAAAPTPAGAAPQDLDLAMPAGGGLLTLRGQDEPTELEQPTTLVGSVDDLTGALTGTLAMAPLSFSFDITSPIPATVYVDAAFSEVTAGSATGTVTKVAGSDGLGNVVVDAVVKVGLHIEVGRPSIVSGDCTASPIALQLTSTAPFDPATGRVALADADFSVPPVPITTACPEILANGVNDALAGNGHALSLTMDGDLPVPEVGAEATQTTLTVVPEGSSGEGDEVTLTATVAAGPDAAPGTPTGLVEFLDGEASVGFGTLDGTGAAVLTSTSLAVGSHALRAAYRGDSTYAPSESAVVEHVVLARPTLDVAMGSTVLIGGLPRTATLTVASPAAIEGARLDFGLRRVNPAGVQPTNVVLDPSRITAEWRDGGTWTPVPLTSTSNSSVAGSVAPPDGLSFPAGTETPVQLRITAPGLNLPPATTNCTAAFATCPGLVELTATLVQTDGEGAVIEELAGDNHRFTLVEGTRRNVSMAILGGLPRPHTVRPGYSLDTIAQVQSTLTQLPPIGAHQVLIDGEPVTNAGPPNVPFAEWTGQVPVQGPNVNFVTLLPPDIEPGRHVFTVRWLGDLVYAPAEVSVAFTVLDPAAGVPVVCSSGGFASSATTFGAAVTVDADLPAAAVNGAVVELTFDDARLLTARPGALNPWAFIGNGETLPVSGDGRLRGITFGVGPDGAGSAAALERQGGVAMPPTPNPADPAEVDQALVFHDATVSVAVTGAPGDSVPVTLDQVAIDGWNGGVDIPIRCEPVGEALTLGEVEVAGVDVTAAPSPAREITDEVTIEAETFPSTAAGTVTFASDVDGDLGTGTVADGLASLDTDELSPGTHVITASFDATDDEVPDTEGTATVVVQYSPRTGTEAFVVAARTDFTGAAGQGDVLADAAALATGQTKSAYLAGLSRSDEYLRHVVDQMYLDTLGRPGEPSGVDFWVGRLRNGWTVDRVAASFYASAEYHSRVGGTDQAWVEDLYQTLLGRTADATGRDYWVGEIQKIGRGNVARRFYQTRESGGFRVKALYDFLLDRAPSASDVSYWTPVVLRRGDLTLAVQLAASPEYAARAVGRFPLV